MVTEQKFIYWDIDNCGNTLEKEITEHSINGFIVHQIQPTNWNKIYNTQEYINSAIIVFHRQVRKVLVINTDGLDKNDIEGIEPIMTFIKYYHENNTLFVELENINGRIFRLFPERIEFLD